MENKTVVEILNSIALHFCDHCCKYEAANEVKGLSMPVCNTEIPFGTFPDEMRFCPNCGAKMGLEEN